MESTTINIILSANNAYAQHLGVIFVSILENSSDINKFVFHILDNNISPENKEKLRFIENKYGTKIIIYKIDDALLSSFPEVRHVLKASYSRLLIADLLPTNIDKVLYLDTDMVILKDIVPLYNTDLNNFGLAAVQDIMSNEITRIHFCPNLNSYFNAGVMLINLKKWRTLNIKTKSLDFVKDHYSQLIRADQDVLNCLFKNDWQALNSCFNVDLKRQSPLSMPNQETVILHYSDKTKPWSYSFVGPSKKYYYHYLAKTPWADFKINDKNLKNFIKKYSRVFIKEIKRLLLPLVPKNFSDIYRRLIWKFYKIN
ncbi:glycosyltransferase family 8 protein [Candidatus Falkowbacteria bacterium]|nr:MAG: glycosyltransferase family 8 protein [Candidatus Falkowbacteria bacterium]